MKDEFDFIDSITPGHRYQPTLIEGIGDDAALVRPEIGHSDILCVDTMVEEIHFNRNTMNAYKIGYKALAVNISDIAAMGGVPKFYLVSIAVPPNWPEEDLRQLYKGMHDLASVYQMDLIGGDTVSTNGPLVVTVTAHGRVPENRKLLRNQAQPGDILFVTGPIGLAAAGLHVLMEIGSNPKYSELINAHQLPQPQVGAGLLLSESGCRIALNDISDGLASEANEIASASQVHITIHYSQLPTAHVLKDFSEEQVLEWMLHGGEDFHLVGSMANKDWTTVKRTFETHNMNIYEIGQVTGGTSGVTLKKDHKLIPLMKKGYNHFK